MDLSNRNEDFAHFDDLTEAGEAEREMISSRVNDMWKDKAVICQIIEENFDDLGVIYYNSFDIQGDIEKAIDGYLETMVKEDLNL